MRTPIIAANWKMHKTAAEAVAFAEKLAPQMSDITGVDAVIAAPFTALSALGTVLRDGPVALAGRAIDLLVKNPIEDVRKFRLPQLGGNVDLRRVAVEFTLEDSYKLLQFIPLHRRVNCYLPDTIFVEKKG